MTKVFADKTKTDELLKDISEKIDVFKDRWPDLAKAGLARTKDIVTESALAHSSTMHYNAFTAASILKMWADVHFQRHESTAASEKNKYTIAELTAHYPSIVADTSGIAKFFVASPTPETNWHTYHEKVVLFQRINADVRNAGYKINRERHEKFLSCLETPVAPTARVSKDQHEAFLWLLKNHDYFYSYSDDNSVYNSGSAQRERLTKIYKTHPHYHRMWDILVDSHDKGIPYEAAKEKWAQMGLEVQQEEE